MEPHVDASHAPRNAAPLHLVPRPLMVYELPRATVEHMDKKGEEFLGALTKYQTRRPATSLLSLP
jgi:hypothetical protein